ncbi:hypothetical protein DMJ13_25715 [halophilic archaeon]|nr:hypothetical protein DMJ13_25715 [halophilic archaeon]
MDDSLASLAQTVPTIFSYTSGEQAAETQMPNQNWHHSLSVLLKNTVTTYQVAVDLHAPELHHSISA